MTISAGEKRRGPRNGASKLTEAQVLAIRARYIPGTGSNRWQTKGNIRALAAEYGINRRTVIGIVSGETWGWLDDEAEAA